jgi:hypothetical protein
MLSATLAFAAAVAGAPCAHSTRPPATEPAHVARWLMAHGSWGVVSTTSAARGGSAWGNVMSFADNCTGVAYFYMSKMDETARDLEAEPRATLTVSEASILGRCMLTDPEDPTCAKLSLHGKVVLAPDQPAARHVLVQKHPAMRTWPAGHGFKVYVMQIADVFVLSNYGGAKPVSVSDYLSASG